MQFFGALTALVTPFKNGAVDEAAYREFIEFQISEGIHGLVPCGTTGESATLSHEEHERVIEICIDQVKGRVPVLAGAGSNNTIEAIRLTRFAQKAGADGALLITPYYNKPTQEGLYRHFKAIAEAVDMPLVPYNVPGRTGTNLLPATLSRLAHEFPNIVGVKEATGDMSQCSLIMEQCPKGFSLLSGDDFTALPLLSIGGSGRRLRSPDVGSSMTIGGREVQEDFVGTLATQTGLVAVLADGMGKAYGARIASRTAVETFLDLFRDYNAFDNPQYYFRKSFHAANRAILRELGDEGYGAASVGVAMIRENWLFYAVVGNVKLCVFRNGDLVPVSAGHTLDVLAEQSFRTGRLSREDALVMLENHRLYNYLGQDSFKDIEIFDRPISLQRGDIIVLMSDGLYELIPWKEIEDVLSGGQDCQSMAYALMEKVNQNSAEDRDNASVILLRWDGSTT